MHEYIELDKAIMEIRHAMKDIHLMMVWSATNYAIKRMRKITAADVIPVVRCKDCEWFAPNNGGEWYGCWLANAIRANEADAPKPNDFCSYGERKNDDG